LYQSSYLCVIMVIMQSMARPAKTQQPEYGAHLASLRKLAHLTQQQLADKVGVRQATVAAWERSATPPRGEFLVPLAESLRVSLDQLLQRSSAKSSKHRGPASRLEELAEQASRLPKRRQNRIASVLEAMLSQETAEASSH
jgi:transcriptional regulator with XRE-family HTH domain